MCAEALRRLPPAPDGVERLTPLLRELCDLKRTRMAGRAGSVAEQAFRRCWARLLEGAHADALALEETAALVAAARLGGLDRAVLRQGGLDDGEATAVLRAGVAEFARQLDASQVAAFQDALAKPAEAGSLDLPAFVAALEAQPRAGATRPGMGRLVLEPPESHADHCMAVAAMAVALAPHFGASPGVPFLAGLAHHLHNAAMPDAGFTGEMLLGRHLTPMVERFTAEALAQLPDWLRERVAEARGVLAHADSPEARAFHAADVLDRVLQQAHYARAASFELRHALEEMELVHEGPLQAFQTGVLREAGLAS